MTLNQNLSSQTKSPAVQTTIYQIKSEFQTFLSIWSRSKWYGMTQVNILKPAEFFDKWIKPPKTITISIPSADQISTISLGKSHLQLSGIGDHTNQALFPSAYRYSRRKNMTKTCIQTTISHMVISPIEVYREFSVFGLVILSKARQANLCFWVEKLSGRPWNLNGKSRSCPIPAVIKPNLLTARISQNMHPEKKITNMVLL